MSLYELYTSTVEPILIDGSSIWDTIQFSLVRRHTSNIAATGDMGWTPWFTKHVNFSRLLRTDERRNSYKILKLISRRRKGGGGGGGGGHPK